MGCAVKSKSHVALKPRNSRRVLPALSFQVHVTVPLPTETGIKENHTETRLLLTVSLMASPPVATLAT